MPSIELEAQETDLFHTSRHTLRLTIFQQFSTEAMTSFTPAPIPTSTDDFLRTSLPQQKITNSFQFWANISPAK